jgi:hypothetical protein
LPEIIHFESLQHSSCGLAGTGIKASTNQRITNNDPLDANTPNNSTFQQGWLQHVVGKFGSKAAGGVAYWLMDNEASIWHESHRDVHPVGATLDEVLNKMIDYGSMAKLVDPTSLVAGPEE